jgi:CDP-diacylglycerol--glycerol-3-phosphate 3-phosphatidyltransferase
MISIEIQHRIDNFVKKHFLWLIPPTIFPNYFTYVRFALVPFLYILLSKEHFLYASLVFAVAAFTDLIDGALARTRDQVTSIGKILDPIADKALILSVLLFMGINYFIVKVFIVIIIFESFANIFAFQKAKYLIGANFFGKIKFVFQVTSVALFFVSIVFDIKALLFWAELSLYAALFFTLISGITIGIKIIKNRQK